MSDRHGRMTEQDHQQAIRGGMSTNNSLMSRILSKLREQPPCISGQFEECDRIECKFFNPHGKYNCDAVKI